MWSHEKIVQGLKEAFSNGFHGMHFIPSAYEGCIGEILSDYLGSDHYVAYRICETHRMIILQPNYQKLRISPQSRLESSYASNKHLHALQYNNSWASFCFDPE
jgi:hypothetical protein